MQTNTNLSLLIMILVIYSVRLLPMLLLRRNIKNRFIRSFLYYVPYVTLAVMTAVPTPLMVTVPSVLTVATPEALDE